MKLVAVSVAAAVVTAGVGGDTLTSVVPADVVTDSVCDGAVDTGAAGAVGGAAVSLPDVAVVGVTEVGGAVAACELLGTAPAVTIVLVGDASVFATGKNWHIAP